MRIFLCILVSGIIANDITIDDLDDGLTHLERKYRRLESKLFDLEDKLDNPTKKCGQISYWKKIYEQSSPSDFARGCDMERCYKKSGNNFIDFRCLEDLEEYHFKIIWDNGAHTMEWIQKVHPLSVTDEAVGLVFVKIDGKDVISETSFNGLSISSNTLTESAGTLLDGMGNHSYWWFSIGYKSLHHGGNPADYANSYVAQKTEMFIKLKPTKDDLDLYYF